MGSKGDVKEFFGMRLAWRVLASCWCSGVSEPDLLVFGCFGTGPKHCFLWVRKVTRKSFLACVLLGVSCYCSGVSEPDQFGCFGTVPKHCFLLLLFFMGSKGDVKEFFGTFSGAGFWTGWA